MPLGPKKWHPYNHPMTKTTTKLTTNGGGYLLCPKCSSEYTRLDDPSLLLPGGDDYLARDNIRGDVLVIPGGCESGHRFNICFGQHKGNTHVWAETISSTDHAMSSACREVPESPDPCKCGTCGKELTMDEAGMEICFPCYCDGHELD